MKRKYSKLPIDPNIKLRPKKTGTYISGSFDYVKYTTDEIDYYYYNDLDYPHLDKTRKGYNKKSSIDVNVMLYQGEVAKQIKDNEPYYVTNFGRVLNVRFEREIQLVKRVNKQITFFIFNKHLKLHEVMDEVGLEYNCDVIVDKLEKLNYPISKVNGITKYP